MDEMTRDPQLAAALRRMEPEPPFDQVDWQAMRARANDGAALALARVRAAHAAASADSAASTAATTETTPIRRAGPRRRTLQWLVPLAAAAGVGGLMLARVPAHTVTDSPGHAVSVTPPAQTPDATINAILDASIPDHVDRAIDGDDQDVLASGALGG